MKYIVDMPEGWKPCWCDEQACSNCSFSEIAPCPISQAVEAVEVKVIPNLRMGCEVRDVTGKKYYEEAALFAERRTNENH